MPPVHRKAKRRRSGYDDEHIKQLLTGVTLTSLTGFGHIHKGLGDIEGMKRAWEELRHELLPKWIAENPGTRPYSWWEWDSPERRQRTDDVVHPFDDRVRKQRVEEVAARHPSFRDEAYRLHRGRPNCLFTTDDFTAKYETELQYLRRLNLLTEAEKALL